MSGASIWALSYRAIIALNLGSHLHLSPMHIPCPLHEFGQVGNLQLSPVHMFWHKHTPSDWHWPWPLQSSGHAFLLQSSPVHPFLHVHSNVSELHEPCALLVH